MKRVFARLDVVKARAEAAKPGPWYYGTDSCDCGGGYPCSHPSWAYEIKRLDDQPDPNWKPENYQFHKSISGKFIRPVAEDMTADIEDGAFMAFARADVPALEAALRIAAEALVARGDEKTLRAIGQALKPIKEDRRW